MDHWRSRQPMRVDTCDGDSVAPTSSRLEEEAEEEEEVAFEDRTTKMSYQNGHNGADNYWPSSGHDPRDIYNRRNTNYLPTPPPNAGTYAHQPAVIRNDQHWNQNAQIQIQAQSPNEYAMNLAYAANVYQPRAPLPQTQIQMQNQQPQYISPAQIFQSSSQPQRSQSYQYQCTAEPFASRTSLSPAYNNTPRMAPPPSDAQSIDKVMLLVSLADEYFEAAHALGPAASLSMTKVDIESYESLIATGLGCLDTVLKRMRISPRLEANIRVRYAGVLFEETENSMEAETTLTKGISLCDRNRYQDLKYLMQFLLARFMAKKNPKAAMKALDGYVNDANAYQHFPWVYAFRFLRASLAVPAGAPTEIHSVIQNLQAVAILASDQGDYPIHLVASLMEAMTYLSWSGPNSMDHVRQAIASAWKYQGQLSCKIPQLLALTHMLDVVSSLEEASTQVIFQKLKSMQEMMDKALHDNSWGTDCDTISIPVRRTHKSTDVISGETRMVLGIGEDGEDRLMMSFLNKKDAYLISYLLSGIVLFHKNAGDTKAEKYLQAGISSLEETRTTKSPSLLPDLISKHEWRGQVLCYYRTYMAFCHASAGSWLLVQQCLNELTKTAQKFDIPLSGSLGLYVKYLRGSYYQGTGNFDAALQIYQDDDFNISRHKSSFTPSAERFERQLILLTALNSLAIYQEPNRRDPRRNKALMENLRPLCIGHANKDIETAWNVMAAAVETDPPLQMLETKDYLRRSLNGASHSGNTQLLCITLSLMFKRFFSNVVGAQAEKSARAASVTAQKNGSGLWRSVADGMLAECLEVQGKHNEARDVLMHAHAFAKESIPQ